MIKTLRYKFFWVLLEVPALNIFFLKFNVSNQIYFWPDWHPADCCFNVQGAKSGLN